MKQFLFLTLLISFCTASLLAQKTDKKLQRQLSEMFRGFNGTVGIYVKDLEKNKIAAVNADTIFPTASMVKIPILVGIMDKINKGELDYHQNIDYDTAFLYPGVDILGSFKMGEKIELSKLMMLSLTMSDNTASLMLQKLAGTGTRINEILDSMGLRVTRVNSRTPGREADRTAFGWGQTSPREMATLMEKIIKGEVINQQISQRMLRLLGRNYWDENAISEIPADVFVASKNGAVNEARDEVLFVHGRGARYVFCICTKNNKDQSWKPENEAWTLTRKVSKLLWEKYGK